MLRCDYKLNTACNRVSIEANTCIQFEKSDDESIPIGTPVLWDEALMLKIDIDKYRIYHICCIFVPNGMYSRITDYKKIWKLAGIPPGFYDGAYTTNHGKMYFGITFGKGRDCFTADTSSLMILVPEGSDFELQLCLKRFDPKRLSARMKNCAQFSKELYLKKMKHLLFYTSTTSEVHSTFSENLLSVSFQPKK